MSVISTADETAAPAPHGESDLFLSYATPDQPRALGLAAALRGLGLRVFLDCLDLRPGDNHVSRLRDALQHRRYLALILSVNSQNRPWVNQEWTSFLSGHGPLGLRG